MRASALKARGAPRARRSFPHAKAADRRFGAGGGGGGGGVGPRYGAGTGSLLRTSRSPARHQQWLRRAEVVDRRVPQHVVVVREEQDDLRRVADALVEIEEVLLVGAVGVGPPVQDFDRAGRSAQRPFQHLGDGLVQVDGVSLDEGIAEGEDPVGAGRGRMPALGVPQAVAVDRHLGGVLAAVVADARAGFLAPAQPRVVLDVARGLVLFLAAAPRPLGPTRQSLEDGQHDGDGDEREAGVGEERTQAGRHQNFRVLA